jgi:DNA-binding NarL/FixJ family response regulator
VARAEESGDAFALGYALNGQALGYQYGQPDETAALVCLERALAAIGDRPETADLRVLLLSNRAVGLLNVGRIAEVPQALGVALEAAERSGSVSRLMVVRSGAVGIYYDCGRWDEALAELDALADLPDLSADTVWQRHATAAEIAVHRDDRETLAIHLAALPDDPSTEDLPQAAARLRVARALALESAGRTDEAAEAILVAGLRPGTNPLAPVLIYDCEWTAPEIVRLALAVGRRAEAEAFTQAITARAQTGAAETVAIAHHCQGLLRADPDLVAAAVDGYALVLDRAQAQENLAVLLAGRGDLHAARAAYEAATETYARLEAAWDLRRAEARLRPLGLSRTPHHIRRRPATGWKALTPTELRVAELVAGGLSNPDVAARLEVSRRTVETHVAHILTKLGGRSRAEIALAHQRHHP